MIPLRRALLWILFSVVAVSGSATVGWTLWGYRLRGRSGDERYTLKVVAQRAGRHLLPTSYLVEQLDLSVDQRVNLFSLNLKECAQRLVASPVIAKARVVRLPPDTLLVEVEPRVPVALLFDFADTAIDDQGRFFPLAPFYTPKRLPEVVLGLPAGEHAWEVECDRRKLELMRDLLDLLSSPPFCDCFCVRRIDLSSAFAPSFGRREIVIEVEIDEECSHLLRVSLSDYRSALYNYLVLIERGVEASVIDLRVEGVAFYE